MISRAFSTTPTYTEHLKGPMHGLYPVQKVFRPSGFKSAFVIHVARFAPVFRSWQLPEDKVRRGGEEKRGIL
jgi:hypothetical protein